MAIAVGGVVEGTVTGITNFGAFVQLPPKTSEPIEIDWTKTDDRQKHMSFEDKLSRFMKESNERQDQLKSRESRKGQKGRSKNADF